MPRRARIQIIEDLQKLSDGCDAAPGALDGLAADRSASSQFMAGAQIVAVAQTALRDMVRNRAMADALCHCRDAAIRQGFIEDTARHPSIPEITA
ncbi:hypothetical protein Q4543_02675 [Salipiger sp. 1_MG-2023]|uniref:hypothetical protein n=1 Tax=Salipiger sp. 1_MG-2023 TaxID=3062665 RepID=UPI0026E42A03|nr:hypothetical protein [Salipiger sp. 1_MG-2023]MDO6584412.1 hypothetical protein [Salipiger sp. 1_MG-2023]